MFGSQDILLATSLRDPAAMNSLRAPLTLQTCTSREFSHHVTMPVERRDNELDISRVCICGLVCE
jgi:hypothetical protein